MDVILLETVRGLGTLGELVSVKPGYGRNYLVPQQKAVYATADAKDKVEEARRKLAKQEAKRLEVATARAALAARAVSITRLANPEGHLFGSVANVDIAEALTTDEVTIEKAEVDLPEGAFKEVGQYTATIILHAEISFEVTVDVIGEEGDVPEGLEVIDENEGAHHLKGQEVEPAEEVYEGEEEFNENE